MKKNRLISTVIAGTLAAAIVVGGGTFAYLKDSTSTVENKFNNNYVDVELTETQHGSEENVYSILPGTTAQKNPTVTYKSSVDSYVFVKVTDTVNADTQAVDYTVITTGEGAWTELTSAAGENYKVYYQEKSATLNPDGEDLQVLTDNKVTYKQSYNNNAGTAEKGNLTFQAFAIQKIKSENAAGESVDFTPAEAWAQLNQQ